MVGDNKLSLPVYICRLLGADVIVYVECCLPYDYCDITRQGIYMFKANFILSRYTYGRVIVVLISSQ